MGALAFYSGATATPACKGAVSRRRGVFTWSVVFACVLFLCALPCSTYAEQNTTCSEPGSVVSVIAKHPNAVTIKCSSEASTLYPPPNTPPSPLVCTTSACDATTPLAVPKAQWSPQKSTGTFTPPENPEAAATVYVQCESSSTNPDHGALQAAHTVKDDQLDKKPCKVQIAVWGPPKQGATYPDPSKCDGGADVKEFEITSNDTTLTFACKQSDTLNPPLFDRVLQGDTCGHEALLESVVPGASLVQHATSTADDTAAYTLTIKDLPKSPQTLCYQCKSAANQMSEDAACKILITVKEAKTDGEVTTPIIPGGATTSAPDASEAGHVLPRTVVCMAATVSVALVLSTLM